MFRLGSFDFAIDDLLQGHTSFVCCLLDVIFRRALHGTLFIVEIFSVGKRHKVFKLRLDSLVRSSTLCRDSVISDIAFAVDL